MDPVTLTLIGASLGGGLLQGLGGKKPKSISPEWLKQHFGAAAVNEEMIQLFNQVINSPLGQQLLTQASEQGQQFERDTATRAASAGFGGGGGAESGASIFSQAAAGGAANALQRGVRSDVMRSAMDQATQLVNSRMNAAVGSEMQRLAAENAQPSSMQLIGDMLARGAAAGLAATPQAAAPAAGATAAAPISPKLPVNALNQAAMMPNTIGTGAMQSTFPSPVTTAPFRRRPGFWSRLATRFGGGQMRMAQSGA